MFEGITMLKPFKLLIRSTIILFFLININCDFQKEKNNKTTQHLAEEYKLGDIPVPKEKYQKYLKRLIVPRFLIENLPSTYDARDDGIVTPAKDQDSCGSCWAFAATGAMESHLIKQFSLGQYDLSEQQQVSCNNDMFGCDGGNSTSLLFWSSTGPVEESCFPYTGTNSQCSYCSNYKTLPNYYRVIDFHYVVPDQYKLSLYGNGPTYFRYDVYTDFYSYWNYGTSGETYINGSGSTFRGGHAVLIIGWDDSRGAYLCKNSWGESSGPNGDGTFWIAYTGHNNDLGFAMSNFTLSLGCDPRPCQPNSCPEVQCCGTQCTQ